MLLATDINWRQLLLSLKGLNEDAVRRLGNPDINSFITLMQECYPSCDPRRFIICSSIEKIADMDLVITLSGILNTSYHNGYLYMQGDLNQWRAAIVHALSEDSAVSFQTVTIFETYYNELTKADKNLFNDYKFYQSQNRTYIKRTK